MAQRNCTYRLSELAEKLDGVIQGSDGTIFGLNTLEKATQEQLSFLANPRYVSQLTSTSAGAVLVTPEMADQVTGTALIVDSPYMAFAKVSQLFDWRLDDEFEGVHPSAFVHASATIGSNVTVGAGVVVDANVTLEDNCIIGPNCVIQAGSIVGQSSRLEANVTLYPDVVLGQNCLVHSGAVIGADGFGFAPSKQGWVKICQLGGVRIGHSVEIGANTTIDRGALDHTYIGDGVKLDNHIQIAHNVVIGEQTAIAGCTAVAGSTKIGRHCTIAGHCGITGHLTIADHTHITAMSLISKSITASGQAFSSGTGQEKHSDWKRNVVRFRQLDDMARRLKQLEQKIDNLSIEGLNK